MFKPRRSQQPIISGTPTNLLIGAHRVISILRIVLGDGDSETLLDIHIIIFVYTSGENKHFCITRFDLNLF